MNMKHNKYITIPVHRDLDHYLEITEDGASQSVKLHEPPFIKYKWKRIYGKFGAIRPDNREWYFEIDGKNYHLRWEDKYGSMPTFPEKNEHIVLETGWMQWLLRPLLLL